MGNGADETVPFLLNNCRLCSTSWPPGLNRLAQRIGKTLDQNIQCILAINPLIINPLRVEAVFIDVGSEFDQAIERDTASKTVATALQEFASFSPPQVTQMIQANLRGRQQCEGFISLQIAQNSISDTMPRKLLHMIFYKL